MLFQALSTLKLPLPETASEHPLPPLSALKSVEAGAAPAPPYTASVQSCRGVPCRLAAGHAGTILGLEHKSFVIP